MANNTSSENRLIVGFTGDLSFSGYFQGFEEKDILANEVKNFFDDNNTVVVNLESPVTKSNDNAKIRLAHRCSPKAVDFVKANFNNPVASLANNHMMDYSAYGLLDTMKYLKEAGIPKIGAGNNLSEAIKPIIIEANGVSAGVIAVQYKKTLIATEKGCGPLHDSFDKEIKAAIKELKIKADYAVVVYHGGEEFLHTPMPYNRKQLHGYIKAGADAVVAHHPHTVQGYEIYKGKMIFYSLGNFIFDTDYQRMQKDTEDGVIVKLIFDKDGIAFDALPININRENHIIETRDEDQYFKNLDEIDYEKLWHKEAQRKVEVLKIVNNLEKQELAELRDKGIIDDEAIRKPKGAKKYIIKIKESVNDPKAAMKKFEKKRILMKGRKAYKKEK